MASFLLEQTSHLFKTASYHGIYCDDGFIVFDGVRSKPEVAGWLGTFQDKVNRWFCEQASP